MNSDNCDICRRFRALLTEGSGSARIIIREWRRHYAVHQCLTWPQVVPTFDHGRLN